MLMAACDLRRYELLGAVGYHDNCSDNLSSALRAMGLPSTATPSPLNLFMNVPWSIDGGLTFERPTSDASQYVSLRGEMDPVVAFSLWPPPLTPAHHLTPTD